MPPDGAFAWAEEPESYAAVATAVSRGVTVYHSSVLDAIALRRPRAEVVQSARAERFAVRKADVAITFSQRVARVSGVASLCPVTLPIPPAVLPLVPDPVAVMIANWAWPPNQAALAMLFAEWPAVRRQVPDARLVIAGRGLGAISRPDGVDVMGEVQQASDALRQASVLAFPCPPTSGPKMKVLDALAWGLPVVTTPAGVEGLSLSSGTVAVVDGARFADELAAVLLDPDRRAQMAAAGRADVLAHHTPARAAAARLALIEGVGSGSESAPTS
jgi:glycosyltransferase involved in cell wall biosynthesis